MFGQIGDMMGMLKKASEMGPKMQAMQESLQKERLVGTAADGRIRVEANGLGVIQRIKIDPELFTPEHRSEVETALIAAINEILLNSKQLHADKMQEAMGGISLPGMDDMLKKVMGGGS